MTMKKGSIYTWPIRIGLAFLSLLIAFQIFVFIHPDYYVANPTGTVFLNIGFFVIPFSISLLITKIYRRAKKKGNKQ